MGKPPRHASGTTGPVIAERSGAASPYEIGITGIVVVVGAFLIGRRLASAVAPILGVSGSPMNSVESCTLPRCTPSRGRRPPWGYVSPAEYPSSRGSE